MKKLIIMLCVIMCAILIGTSVTFAWLSLSLQKKVDIDAALLSQYFDCGTGTEDDPYVITRPIHYYHLVQLYLRKYDTYALDGIYYQLGRDMTGDGKPEVYAYDNNGITDGKTYSNSLNMNCYETMLPIGTSAVPFCANFNGNGLEISNLNIVGNGLCDIGIFGYVSSNADIHDIYFNNVMIDVDGVSIYSDDLETITDVTHNAHEGKSYVGYIVGHLTSSTNIHSVFVNNCSITGSSNIDSLYNDWGYFGCCENAMPLEDFVAMRVGGGVGFGASVDMESMYNRIESIESNSRRITISENNIDRFYNSEYRDTTNSAINIEFFYDEKIGSFVWYPYSTTSWTANYNYLGGGVELGEEYYDVTYENLSGHYIYSGTNYLHANETTLAREDRDKAIVWNLSTEPSDGESTTISIRVNNRTYYLRYNNGLSLSTTSYNWTYEASETGYRLKNGSRYLRYNGGWTTTTQQRNATTLNFEEATIQLEHSELVESSNWISYDTDYVTYFPLVTYADNTVAKKNTGYVVSGSSYRASGFPVKSGDIRVSKYSTSDINASYSTRNGLTTVYTINASGTRQTVNRANYVRYNDAEVDFLSMISSGNIYGLHFMNGLIDIENLVNLKYAMINGEEYTNYKVPSDSIDFNLVEKGYITFFAGTYFSGNNSFFSLHNIIRDENNDIVDILEIEEIYATNNEDDPYIYRYSDGSYSALMSASYKSIFKTSQIKKQNSLTSNAVYYFEIPVNEGEYALGSVDGGTGAYLMYLDIGTNGGKTDGEELVDDFESIEYRSYPDTTDTSVFLLTYKHPQGSTVTADVSFEDDTYTVTVSCDKACVVYASLLDSNYVIVVNDKRITQLGTTIINLN